jgi:fatty acid desaturase
MEKLDLTWLISLLSGFNTLRRVSVRNKSRNRRGPRAQIKIRYLLVLVTGLLLHVLILGIVYNYLGLYALVVWVCSTFILTPALGSLRNLLEHKYVEGVDTAIWYQIIGRDKPENVVTTVTTRTFTHSLLSRLYGSMGFTRHLLHHWDPSVSFSNLGSIHKFLLETPLEGNLRKVDSTFTSTFLHLWGK